MSEPRAPRDPRDPKELARVMRETYAELIDFVTTPEFKALSEEITALPATERPVFVKSVLLNKAELKKRGIVPPEGILIQRSSFGDRRPTLFCVKKYLPEEYQYAWENVNLTFDNTFADEDVSRDPELCWRRPLPVETQSQLLGAGVRLEELDADYGEKAGELASRKVQKRPAKSAS